MPLTKVLKETVQHNGKFLTLSLAVTLQKKCIDEFMRLGISPQALSFLAVGLEKVAEDIALAAQFVKENEEVEKMLKDVNLDGSKDGGNNAGK